MTATGLSEWVEFTLEPNKRAARYRAIAAQIRTTAQGLTLDDARAALINLALAYDRMADAADPQSQPAPPPLSDLDKFAT